MTPYGRRKEDEGDTSDDASEIAGAHRSRGSSSGTRRWMKVFGVIVVIALLVVIILHLTGGGLGRHS